MKKIKLIIPTLLFYTVAFATLFILNKVDPGGPCVPGLGALCLLLLIPVSIGLLIKNIYTAIKKDKNYFIVVATHVVVMVTFLIV